MEQQQFLQDFQSKAWCSYRKQFPNIGTTKLVSDSGWGCMVTLFLSSLPVSFAPQSHDLFSFFLVIIISESQLRSGQMMLAGAFLRHFLGPEWRLARNKSDSVAARKYKTIMSWFADRNGSASPYSLANMAVKGVKFDTPIGQWHGPTTTAQILKLLVAQHAPGGFKGKNPPHVLFLVCLLTWFVKRFLTHSLSRSALAAYVSQDATVYKSDIKKICEKKHGSECLHSPPFLCEEGLNNQKNFPFRR